MPNQSPLKIVLDTVGSDTFVGLYTTRNLGSKKDRELAKKEIDTEYNLCYNHGVTRGELHWLHDGFAFFGTDKERLHAGLLERRVCYALRQSPSADEEKLERNFKGLVSAYIQELPRESFVENVRAHAKVAV